MKIKLKLLHPDAQTPEYAHLDDAGCDLKSVEEVVIQPHQRAVIGTGLAIGIPSGYEGQVRSRSGLAAKHGVFVLNSPGTIDSGYQGEIKVILYNSGAEPFNVTKGMKIAQLVFASLGYPSSRRSPDGWLMYDRSFEVVDNLGESDRGLDGFGSTGI